jgi:hypothetical protein
MGLRHIIQIIVRNSNPKKSKEVGLLGALGLISLVCTPA